jgi:hypothetical protein
MARQINLFNFTGKLGNVVGYSYKGKYCLRSRPVRKSKTVSLVQLIQKEKFAIAGKFVRSLSPLLAYSIPDPKKMTQSNFVMSHTLKNAMYGNYPDFHIDYSQVPVCYGNLQPAQAEQVVCKSGNLIFTWNDDIFQNNASPYDRVILAAYCEDLNQCFYSTNSTVRQTGIAPLAVKPFKNHEVHTWMAFKSEDGKSISRSTYTGALFVT